MLGTSNRHNACGRHFDSVQLWTQTETEAQITELLKENAALKERTRNLALALTDLTRVIEKLEKQLLQRQ